MNGNDKNDKLTEQDLALWRDATRNITSQSDRKSLHKQKKETTKAGFSLPSDMELWHTYIEEGKISSKDKPPALAPEEEAPHKISSVKPKYKKLLANNNSDLDKRSFEKLRKGRIHLDDYYDFHGISLIEAKFKLNQLIDMWYENGKRCVLLITGKGKRSPKENETIRQNIGHWLNEYEIRPKILAFTKAQPKDGGEGAFYILLRRKK